MIIKNHLKPRLILFFSALGMLILGGAIYLFFRPHTIRMFQVLKQLHLEWLFKQHFINPNSSVQSFIVYSLPTGLWFLSYLIIQGLLWNNKRRFFYFYTISFFIASLTFEIGQKTDLLPGTFDIADVIVLIVAFILGVLIYEKSILAFKH